MWVRDAITRADIWPIKKQLGVVTMSRWKKELLKKKSLPCSFVFPWLELIFFSLHDSLLVHYAFFFFFFSHSCFVCFLILILISLFLFLLLDMSIESSSNPYLCT